VSGVGCGVGFLLMIPTFTLYTLFFQTLKAYSKKKKKEKRFCSQKKTTKHYTI
jgi:hypothetical protein